MIFPISKDLYLVYAPNGAKFPYCHCLLVDGDVKVLFDTGCGEEDLAVLKELKPDIIINTHYHEDHILHNADFPESRIWAHRLDAPAISSREAFKEYFGFTAFDKDQLGEEFLDYVQLQPTPVDRELENGDVLDFGRLKFRVVHAPGHSAGHCAFHLEENNTLLTGDIDLSNFGPWYGNVSSDLEDFIQSIKKCQEINPDFLISSHKGIIADNIQERLQKYLDIIFQREEKILRALETPLTLDQLAAKRIFYGDRFQGNELYGLMEKIAITKHLEKLMRLGEIEKDTEVYFRK
ncbi:MAG: MBL fold metallo-hydrolase [Syntrophomonadaceae bacterium]|jgi:glyoxylase-like metal-dependent hydrolase (beta-lactamase superfamily II)